LASFKLNTLPVVTIRN